MSQATPLPFDVIAGDIGAIAESKGPWLAVVSSDDNYLSHGGGCSRSLWRAAYLDSVDDFGVVTPLSLGSVVATPGGRLDTQRLIHVVTLDVDTRQSITPDMFGEVVVSLANQVRSFQRMPSNNVPKVLVPLLGTGVAGIAEGIAVEYLARFALLTASGNVRCVFCVLDQADRYRRLFAESLGLDVDVPCLREWLGRLQADPDPRAAALIGAIEAVGAGVQSKDGGIARQPSGAHAPNWDGIVQAIFTEAEGNAKKRLLDAVEIRNRLAHRVGSPDVISCHGLEVGLRVLVKSALDSRRISEPGIVRVLQGCSSEAPSTRAGGEETRLPKERDRKVAWFAGVAAFACSPHSMRAEASAAIAHRSEHVDRMVELLLCQPSDQVDHLREECQELGYKGDLKLQVKEYCVRGDPLKILQGLGTLRLKRILTDRYSESVSAKKSTRQMAVRVLHHLGFRMPSPLRDLDAVIAEVSRLESELLISDVHGLVTQASKKLEQCIRDLLRFMCLYLYSHGPEQHFKEHVNESAASDMGRATLGTLLHCLEILAQELDDQARSEGVGTLRELHGPLNARRLAPGGVGTIAKLRNDFIHYRSEASDRDDVGEARTFFRGAMALLRHWKEADPPIYPMVIRVKRIIVDEWNRRSIEAETAGQKTELIVCDQPVEPGGTYFMYPLSNPFRVDPILIEFNASAAVSRRA